MIPARQVRTWLSTAPWLVLVMLASVSTARAGVISELVVFGDSLSDRGNVRDAFGVPADPPYSNGRFTNGPIWVDVLASDLGVPAPAPSRLGGTNYAWGGANTNTSGVNLLVPNMGTQIGQYLAADTPSSGQLFVLWGGANDFNTSSPIPAAASVAANMAANISTLAAAGAEHFLVPNLPRLGQLPRNKGTALEATLDQSSIDFNQELATQLDGLTATLGISIRQLDVFSLFEAALSDPAAFGLTNTTGTAKVVPDDFLTPVPDTEVVANPDEYLWFDSSHPTRVAHAFVGHQAAAIPEPATLALLGLAGTLCGLGRRRRSCGSCGRRNGGTVACTEGTRHLLGCQQFKFVANGPFVD